MKETKTLLPRMRGRTVSWRLGVEKQFVNEPTITIAEMSVAGNDGSAGNEDVAPPFPPRAQANAMCAGLWHPCPETGTVSGHNTPSGTFAEPRKARKPFVFFVPFVAENLHVLHVLHCQTTPCESNSVNPVNPVRKTSRSLR